MKSSLDYNLTQGEGSKMITNIRKDIEDQFKKLRKTKNKSDKQDIWSVNLNNF